MPASRRNAAETVGFGVVALQKFTAKTPIDFTALIELESRGARTFYFSAPKPAAPRSRSPIESPPGKELVGKKTGDRIKLVMVAATNRDMLILLLSAFLSGDIQPNMLES